MPCLVPVGIDREGVDPSKGFITRLAPTAATVSADPVLPKGARVILNFRRPTDNEEVTIDGEVDSLLAEGGLWRGRPAALVLFAASLDGVELLDAAKAVPQRRGSEGESPRIMSSLRSGGLGRRRRRVPTSDGPRAVPFIEPAAAAPPGDLRLDLIPPETGQFASASGTETMAEDAAAAPTGEEAGGVGTSGLEVETPSAPEFDAEALESGDFESSAFLQEDPEAEIYLEETLELPAEVPAAAAAATGGHPPEEEADLSADVDPQQAEDAAVEDGEAEFGGPGSDWEDTGHGLADSDPEGPVEEVEETEDAEEVVDAEEVEDADGDMDDFLEDTGSFPEAAATQGGESEDEAQEEALGDAEATDAGLASTDRAEDPEEDTAATEATLDEDEDDEFFGMFGRVSGVPAHQLPPGQTLPAGEVPALASKEVAAPAPPASAEESPAASASDPEEEEAKFDDDFFSGDIDPEALPPIHDTLDVGFAEGLDQDADADVPAPSFEPARPPWDLASSPPEDLSDDDDGDSLIPRNVRIPSSLEVNFWAGGRNHVAQAHNFSREGLYLARGGTPPIRGAIVRVEFPVDWSGEPQPIRFNAEVRWHRADNPGANVPDGFGVQILTFEGPKDQERYNELLIHLLQLKQRQQPLEEFQWEG